MNGRRRTALAALLILALIGPIAVVSAQTPAPTGPITIGVLAPSTGPFATYARDIIDGARLYSDEVGGQLGRRKLELVVEDYQTTWR
jgi:branched-chain amino acid transport system substrate-binding protein